MDMPHKPVIHAWIFARGGSKGLPGKNIKPLKGKPLIAWAIDAARQSRHISEVFVSTDSEEIAAVARQHGAVVPFLRPVELATDQAPERLAWRHAIDWEQSQSEYPTMDVLVAVPTTTPLRTAADIDACIDLFLEGGAETVIGVTPSDRHPSFNMVTLDERQYAQIAKPLQEKVHRRQDVPPVYNITTAAYVTTPSFVQKAMVYMAGNVRACILPSPCAVDIDTADDFRLAEAMLSESPGAAALRRKPSLYELLSLAGRVAVVTGGAGHLGRAMLSALAEAGAGVVVVDLDADASRKVADDLTRAYGVSALGLAADLADEEAVRAIPGRVVEALGRMDILVNNAAYVGTSGLSGWAVPFEQQSSDTWRKALEVNLTAVFNLTQASREALLASGHGSIINIASIYGIVGPNLELYEGTAMGNPAAYAASKGGLVQFTRWCATVLAPYIRVNAITPGGIFRNQSGTFLDRYVSRTPMKRMGTEDDFQGAIAYLASDLSNYVTGQNLVVDGGFSVW
jgi:NAD(P)-dependent dehydrogenase (short-subunit alcohol dehydrogenase family)/CMP-N-acetylneuraminic acid synthetase